MTDPAHRGPVVELDATVVLDLVDRSVAAAPDAAAVIDRIGTLSYRELDRRADATAARLRDRYGIGPGDVVMLAAEAGAEFTVGVLGTLRAGAAYLPVDLAYPPARLAEIAAAARATLVLHQGVLPPELAASGTPGSLAELTAPATDPVEWSRPALGPGDPAYLIFSSGSTGGPKGIVQSHGCLLNFVYWQAEASGLGPRRRVLQAAALSFDVSVQEVFYTLASGGTLIVPDPDVRRDPRALVEFMIEHRVEVVDLPQSMIDVIMRMPQHLGAVGSLRHLIDAGETVRITPALKGLLQQRPELTLHNHYGPAENNMLAFHLMSAGRDNLEPRPPVGALIWNVHLYLLDDDGQPVPDGEVGEVYIGGAGVALGYTDPELTARHFLPDPYEPGRRVYRTRDRGRWRPDATLELLGRADDLIKIRGNAVEPREVERHLRTIPGVQDAAVFGRTRPDGAVELHAVLTGEPPAVPDLRKALLAELPEFMAPVRWWKSEELPHTPHGKLDRRGLPGPGATPLSLRPR